VSIVGAGPGAADLISVRGYHALRSADAILVDRLLPATFLEDLGISAAGKLVRQLGGDEPHWTQEEVNRWLVAAAGAGRTVVRLKGGDPFVFGRGDSEIECLDNHRIAWEIIPGASSATAVLSSAGFPLTRHGKGRSFAVTTARVEGGRLCESFPRADSLVIFMGVAVLEQVVSELLADGWPADTPSAIVERGTLAWQRHSSGPLCQLNELARRAGVTSHALVVVGEAATAIPAIRRRPTILYTGLDVANFRALGNVLHWPALAAVENPEGRRRLPRALASLNRGDVDWVVFSDKLAVKTFCTAMADHRLDGRAMRGARIAVLGAETARRLEQYRLCADVVVAEGGLPNGEAWLGKIWQKRVLVVQGTHAPRGFRSRLEAAGAAVDHLVLHRLVPHPELGRPLPNHDVVYFVSPAGVRAYAKTYRAGAFSGEVWCLGDATRTALAAHGVVAAVVAPAQPSMVCFA
jgi:uroporphyrinogen III methyltransferase / synthase